MNKKLKGYTLIEILVVIAIIGFIAATTMYALSNARMKSRDAKRLVDIQTIKKAVELYYDDNGIYPGNNGWYYNDACIGGAYSGPISALISPNYLSSVPDDPNNNTEGGGDYGCYWYQRRNSGGGYVLLMSPENSNLFNGDMDCFTEDTFYCIGENW